MNDGCVVQSNAGRASHRRQCSLEASASRPADIMGCMGPFGAIRSPVHLNRSAWFLCLITYAWVVSMPAIACRPSTTSVSSICLLYHTVPEGT